VPAFEKTHLKPKRALKNTLGIARISGKEIRLIKPQTAKNKV